jgi:hypothetical protein
MIFGNSNMLQPSHNTVPGNHKISNLMKNIKYIFYITIPHPTIHHFHPKFRSFGPVIDISSPHPIICICSFLCSIHPPYSHHSTIHHSNYKPISNSNPNPTINHPPSLTIQYPIHNPPFNPRDPHLQIKI